MALSQYWLAARVGLFLLSLPLRLRRHALPPVLESLRGREATGAPGLEPRRVAEIVRRVSRLSLFRHPIFPRTCLRQSLALFYVLSRSGHPVAIHFGVRRDGEELGGHSWVVLDGRTLGEREPAHDFRTIFSYSVSGRPALLRINEPQLT